MDSDVSQSSAFIDFIAWLQVNRKRLIIGGVVVVGAGLIVAAVVYGQSQKEARASEALSEVKMTASPGQPTPAGLADAYLKVAKDYAGTKAGGRALLQGAGQLFVDGKYADAQQRFEQITKEYPESPWLAQAFYGVAASLDAQKKSGEAMTKFEELRRRFAGDPMVDEAKLALARLYEDQNKPTEAYKLYEEVLKANPNGGVGQEAGMRQEDLARKHPEVVPKTNTPPMVVTPPAVARTNFPIVMTNRPTIVTNKPSIVLTNVLKQTPSSVTSEVPVKKP